METNMSGLEQAVRFLLGVLILVYAALSLSGFYLVLAVIVGAILLATGGIGYCPAYGVFGARAKARDTTVEYRTGQTSKSKKTVEERRRMRRR